MADKLKDILSNLSPEINQDMLLLYLQDKLTEEKKHEVEKTLLNNEFVDDAMEGLQQFGNKNQLGGLVKQLNTELKNKLAKKKKRAERLRIKEQPWIYIVSIIILLLIVISFVIVRRLHSHIN